MEFANDVAAAVHFIEDGTNLPALDEMETVLARVCAEAQTATVEVSPAPVRADLTVDFDVCWQGVRVSALGFEPEVSAPRWREFGVGPARLDDNETDVLWQADNPDPLGAFSDALDSQLIGHLRAEVARRVTERLRAWGAAHKADPLGALPRWMREN